MDMVEDVQEDSGWKLVHGDVFRPPKYALLLSVLLGSGSQLFMMVGATTSTHPSPPLSPTLLFDFPFRLAFVLRVCWGQRLTGSLRLTWISVTQ